MFDIEENKGFIQYECRKILEQRFNSAEKYRKELAVSTNLRKRNKHLDMVSVS